MFKDEEKCEIEGGEHTREALIAGIHCLPMGFLEKSPQKDLKCSAESRNPHRNPITYQLLRRIRHNKISFLMIYQDNR